MPFRTSHLRLSNSPSMPGTERLKVVALNHWVPVHSITSNTISLTSVETKLFSYFKYISLITLLYYPPKWWYKYTSSFSSHSQLIIIFITSKWSKCGVPYSLTTKFTFLLPLLFGMNISCACLKSVFPFMNQSCQLSPKLGHFSCNHPFSLLCCLYSLASWTLPISIERWWNKSHLKQK